MPVALFGYSLKPTLKGLLPDQAGANGLAGVTTHSAAVVADPVVTHQPLMTPDLYMGEVMWMRSGWIIVIGKVMQRNSFNIKLDVNKMNMSKLTLHVCGFSPILHCNFQTNFRQADDKLGLCLVVAQGQNEKVACVWQANATLINPRQALTLYSESRYQVSRMQ